MNNFEKIKQMSPETMARFLFENNFQAPCSKNCGRKPTCYCIIDYLMEDNDEYIKNVLNSKRLEVLGDDMK